MKKMTAKEYLEQLAAIEEMIQQDLERLEGMKQDAMLPKGIDYSGDRVQTSTRGDKLCCDVTSIITLNDKINAEIDRFVDAKEKIISEIRGMRCLKYNRILYKVYVQFKSIREAAGEMKISYSYAVELHKKALKAFSETYKNLYYLT